MKRSVILTVFMCFTYVQLSAQQAYLHLVSSAGTVFSTESLSMSWSIGEIATETFSNDKLMLTQGFQQSNLQSTNISVNEGMQSIIKLYPNPANIQFFVSIKDAHKSAGFALTIFGLNGKALKKQSLINELSVVDIQQFQPGNYFVHILNVSTKAYQTFNLQIIK